MPGRRGAAVARVIQRPELNVRRTPRTARPAATSRRPPCRPGRAATASNVRLPAVPAASRRPPEGRARRPGRGRRPGWPQYPVRPSSSARQRVHQRKPTPWTMPCTQAVSRTSGPGMAGFGVDVELDRGARFQRAPDDADQVDRPVDDHQQPLPVCSDNPDRSVRGFRTAADRPRCRDRRRRIPGPPLGSRRRAGAPAADRWTSRCTRRARSSSVRRG